MTDREAFEAWFVDGRDESGLESVDKSDGENSYVYSDTKMALAAWQAAVTHERSKAPAWRDAPDVPGLWVSTTNWGGTAAQRVRAAEIRDHTLESIDRRWYGPIPSEDKP